MSEEAGEKSHEASQKRLEDLRRDGRVARSADLQAAVALAAFLLALLIFGASGAARLGAVLAGLLSDSPRLSALWAQGAAAVLAPLLLQILLAVLPLLALPGLAVLVWLLVQRGLLFTPGNLAPRLSRLSPLGQATQRFGPAGLVDFGRNLAKLGIIGAALGAFLWSRLDAIIAAAALPAPAVILLLYQQLASFLWLVVAILLAIGAADYLWQRLRHARDARMTRQQMIEEHREAEGDPQARAQRRQRGQEIALNRMMRDVPMADVVIVNPTHYAVALKWDRAARRAPVCVAKGVDEVAARIRAQARLAGVPIHEDPATARALHAVLRLGEEIRPEHYKAVAAAIRFARSLRAKAEPRRDG